MHQATVQAQASSCQAAPRLAADLPRRYCHQAGAMQAAHVQAVQPQQVASVAGQAQAVQGPLEGLVREAVQSSLAQQAVRVALGD